MPGVKVNIARPQEPCYVRDMINWKTLGMVDNFSAFREMVLQAITDRKLDFKVVDDHAYLAVYADGGTYVVAATANFDDIKFDPNYPSKYKVMDRTGTVVGYCDTFDGFSAIVNAASPIPNLILDHNEDYTYGWATNADKTKVLYFTCLLK